MSQERTITKVVPGQPTSDGAGVKLTRMIGTAQLDHLDPFLMLDCFESDKPDDYLAGFPSHPHRGFETVTYIMNGRMRHKDSQGHEGVIEEGGVQWMTAGRGVVHSEMPEQKEGLLKGFQLWVNLPAKDKMCQPHYQEHSSDEIPRDIDENGNIIRVIAGQSAKGTKGPIQTAQTQASYFDISMVAGNTLALPIPSDHAGFIYTVSGDVTVVGSDYQVKAYHLGVLSEGEQLTLEAKTDSRLLVITGKPIREPIAWGGPFVMNTREEVYQAFEDFRANRF